MNKQAVFETAVSGIYRQGGYAVKRHADHVLCCYRAPNGNKCAVGMLIPDSAYVVELEGMGLMMRSPLGKILSAAVDANNPGDFIFLGDLQFLHDVAAVEHYSMEQFLANATNFANEFGLNTDFMKELTNANNCA